MSREKDERSGIAELASALLGLSEDALDTGRNWAGPKLEKGRFWLRAVFLGLLLWPVILLLVSLATPAAAVDWLVATIALVVPSVILVALVVKWPFISVAIAAASARIAAARKLVGWLLLAVFFELAAGIYLAVVPVERAPELLVLRVLVIAALGVLTLSVRLLGIKGSPFARSMTAILVLLLVGITVAVFFGGVNGIAERLKESADAGRPQIVEVCPGEPESYNFGDGVTQLTLQSQDGCWSGWVITPPGATWRIDYSRPVDLMFIDGTVLLNRVPGQPRYHGVKEGVFRVRGSAQITVTIDN